MNYWERLWILLENAFFSEIVLIVMMVFALYTGLKCPDKNRIEKFLVFYTMTALCVFITVDIDWVFNLIFENRVKVTGIANIFYCVTEVTIFYMFFFSVLHYKLIKKVMKVILTGFYVLAVGLTYKIFSNTIIGREVWRITDWTVSVELILLLVPCVSYFYQLLRQKNYSFESPELRFVCAIFIYAVVLIVPFLVLESLINTHRIFFRVMLTVHYLSLSYLFFEIKKRLAHKKSVEHVNNHTSTFGKTLRSYRYLL